MSKYFILIIVAGYIIQAIAGHLAKKKEEERLREQDPRKREMARQREQAARAGGIQGLSQGNPPTVQTLSQPQSAASRRKAQLQELKQRREQQLEELRRRRQMQQRPSVQARTIQPQQPQTSRQIPQQQPSLARSSRGLTQRSQQVPKPLPSRKPQAPQHSLLHTIDDKKAADVRREKARGKPAAGRLLVDRPEPIASVKHKEVSTTSLRSMLSNPASLRQAFILKELLDKPVSLRETDAIC